MPRTAFRPPRTATTRLSAALLLTTAVACATAAVADSTGNAHREAAPAGPSKGKPAAMELPPRAEFEGGFPAGRELSGKELYDRFLSNRRRLRTLEQRGRVLSEDPGGNPQLVHFSMLARDYRSASNESVDDTFAKVLLRFVGPHDLEGSAYLLVDRDKADDDEFMYSPHRDRTMRVKLSGQSVAGTDFTFDDFLVHMDDLDDATYERLPDEVLEGAAVYVVAATMLPGAESNYSRSIQYLEQQHYVPLKSRYWDAAGIETRRITSPRASIREFGGAWIATELTGTDLHEKTSSTIHVDAFVPDPPIDDTELSIARLNVTN